MAFHSLNDILGPLARQTLGEKQQDYQRLVESWNQAVGPKIAPHTRPLVVDRGVLKVATSSAAWAQTLTFERRRILQRLNRGRTRPIADIRFSPRDWLKGSETPLSSAQTERIVWQQHPSRLSDPDSTQPPEPENSETPGNNDPLSAFDRWAFRLQARSRSLPLCPHCSCPTPPGELERWSVCALCATQRF
ncbi:DUF721 domain-containing protein [Phormidium sp. CCY1219]|uniref:DUF721 domain-containing protein n=1 Tax=Phormidium sp. CCY1219 TaxID=2886104 RepID=UPI002D1F0BA4|nr:DUF721 domain-containing protein [Phormidium sp. CCY1219]MEB3825899.1 DUF721 domain-containing protein [Phormidium sp. CCY1219]